MNLIQSLRSKFGRHTRTYPEAGDSVPIDVELRGGGGGRVSLLTRWDFDVPDDAAQQIIHETGASSLGHALYKLSDGSGWESVFWDERIVRFARWHILQTRARDMDVESVGETSEELQQLFLIENIDNILFVQDDVF